MRWTVCAARSSADASEALEQGRALPARLHRKMAALYTMCANYSRNEPTTRAFCPLICEKSPHGPIHEGRSLQDKSPHSRDPWPREVFMQPKHQFILLIFFIVRCVCGWWLEEVVAIVVWAVGGPLFVVGWLRM
eukprot:2215714-Prymnesium_polylepis.1